MNSSEASLRRVWALPRRFALLGEEVGRGGEARVLSIGHGLAKIYRPEVLASERRRLALQEKIEALCRVERFPSDSRFAWPLFLLFADADCRQWIGFAMRRCGGVAMNALCGLQSLRENFPGWDRLNVARAVRNLVDGLIALESTGIVVGDVSPANFRVEACGSVSFLDVDSYQVRENGRLHRCPVMSLRYAPPETLDLGRTDFERLSGHLFFSAAVLIFELLSLGVHPYQRAWGDDPIANLRSGRTAIGGTRASGFIPGPLYQRYRDMHPAVMRLCVLAFVDGHANPAARPTLVQWRAAIARHIQWLESATAAA